MQKTILITGAAKRLGATIATTLQQHGYRMIIHCNQSREEAEQLVSELNQKQANSADLICQPLHSQDDCKTLIQTCMDKTQQLDGIVHNASSFYPTPIDTASETDFETLFTINAKIPFFLSQAAYPYLKTSNGMIVSIADIHAQRPIKNFSLYCMSKSALVTMTQSLAREFAPDVRVNAIAPGMMMWSEHEQTNEKQNAILKKIPLQKTGTAKDIAEAVLFLFKSDYITGTIMPIDGGRLLNI